MQQNILLTGADDLLAAYVAAQYLSLTKDTMIYRAQMPAGDSRAEFTARVAACLRRSVPDMGPETIQRESSTRLHMFAADLHHQRLGLPDSAQPDEVWHFVPTHRHWKQHSSAALARVLRVLPALGVHQFNLVMAADAGPSARDSREAARDAARQCQARGIACRMFRTALLLAESDPYRQDHDLLWFLAVLNNLKREIQERASAYFDFETFKVCVPSGPGINLLHAVHASAIMVRLARLASTANRAFDIAAPENMPVSDFFQRAASVFGLGLLATDDQEELNAIDLVFQERLGAFHAYLASGPRFDSEEAFRLAGFKPELTLFDKSSLLQVLKSLHRGNEAELAARDERVAALPAQLERRTLDRNGSELVYCSAGSEGPPVLVLNALGQGLTYWYRLLDILRHRRRVILWEPRGTVAPAQPFGLNDQIDDMLAILQREQIGACHLAAWCTGPKLAIEFYLRHPNAVLSIAMLNSQFKIAGTPRELVTAYENNIEPVFRALQNNPAIADYAMKSLQLSLGDRKLDFFEQTDGKQLAVQVLALTNSDLKPLALAPFQSEATTLNYARQIVDFWAFDSLAKAGQVKVPVLMITSEYDRIAAPAMSRLAVRQFPHASLIEVQGATHYCLYDRPEFMAGLIEELFASAQSHVEEVAVTT